jgi:hypothetical protein
MYLEHGAPSTTANSAEMRKDDVGTAFALGLD